MYRYEKVFNELTLISTLVTMLFAFLYKDGKVHLFSVIIMCFVTFFLYLSSRIVIKKSSEMNEKDKEALESIKKEFNIDKKKGKKKNVKKNSSDSR